MIREKLTEAISRIAWLDVLGTAVGALPGALLLVWADANPGFAYLIGVTGGWIAGRWK
jgi:hypothetical protein